MITVSGLREHVTTGLGDDALQRLIDDAEATIVARVGALGAYTELANGGYRTTVLGRHADSITSVSETIGTTTTVLAASDYRLRPDGYTLERLSTGTNPRWYWLGLIEVVSVSTDDEAIRDLVVIDLCRLALSYNPGLTMEQIGAWTEQYNPSAVWNNATEREAILSRLNPSPGMVVVGSSYWASSW